MLTLTKIRREVFIDHVMPSDLDKDDIKHGLQLKEKMLLEINDDYIKKTIPNWEEIERDYRKRGVSDIMDKVICGEMSLDDIPKPNCIKCDVWMRWKDFNQSDYDSDPNYGKKDYDYPVDNPNDLNVARNGYSEWIKETLPERKFNLRNKTDIVLQLQIVMYGDNHGRYYPYQDYAHGNGWFYISDDLTVYDFDVGINPFDGGSPDPSFYRLFFRNKKGYGDPKYEGWHWEDKEWFKQNYPNLVDENDKVHATTIMCDPFRVKYTKPEDKPYGSVAVLTGRQWVKRSYKLEMMNCSLFNIYINNMNVPEESGE